MKRLLLALILCGAVLSPPEATADHAVYRWAPPEAPQPIPVAANCAEAGGLLCSYVDAANTAWMEAGFHKGLTRIPPRSCALHPGITVCANFEGADGRPCPPAQVVAGEGETLLPPIDALGCAHRMIQSGTNNLTRVLIFLCSNCNLSPALWHVVTTHEIGHGLGLDHTADDTSIMGQFADGSEVMTHHEREALASLYLRVAPVVYVNVNSGLAMNVAEGSRDNGAKLIQYPVSNGPNEKVRRIATPRTGVVSWFLFFQHSYSVADASTDGSRLWQWGLHRGNNQRWEHVAQPNGSVSLRNVHTGKCMDVLGGSVQPYAEIVQWTCHGGPNQQWTTRRTF